MASDARSKSMKINRNLLMVRSSSIIKCPDCPKSFAKRMDYNRHRKKHDKPYCCSLCIRGFALRNDLDRHRRHHLLLKPREFRCLWPSCDKVYARKDFLLKHMRNRHEGPAPSASDFEETQEEIRQLYMQSVKKVDEDPLVKRKESFQLALMDAAISGCDLKFNELLIVEDEMIPFLMRFAACGLTWALNKGLEAAARRFIFYLSQQQDISEVAKEGMVAAAANGYDDIILLLLKHDVPLDFPLRYWPFWTPLEAATNHGHASTVRLLLAHGADVNGDHKFSIPLITAVKEQNEEFVRILLEHGADPNLSDLVNKCSALSLAEGRDLERIQRLLREHASHV